MFLVGYMEQFVIVLDNSQVNFVDTFGRMFAVCARVSISIHGNDIPNRKMQLE